MRQEPIQNGGGGRDIANQFTPIFDRTIRRHDRRFHLMTPQDDLKEIFARLLGQMLDAHVIDDQQIGLEVFRQDSILTGEGLIRHQLPHQVEDRTIQDRKAQPNCLGAQGLNQMAFAHARRTDEEDIARLTDEVARRQFIESVPFDARVEGPVEVFERLEFSKTGDLGSPFELPLIAEVQFIPNEQLQEFLMAQPIARCLLESDLQTRSKSRKSELFEL